MIMACCGLEEYATADSSFDQKKSLCPSDVRPLSPSALLPVGEYFSAAQYESELASLDQEGARFDFDDLMDTCSTVPCDGVDDDQIRNLSIEADCRAESYVILCCTFLLLALYDKNSLYSLTQLFSFKPLLQPLNMDAMRGLVGVRCRIDCIPVSKSPAGRLHHQP